MIFSLTLLLLSVVQADEFRWTVSSRIIEQVQGDWHVLYGLKNESKKEITVRPEDLSFNMESWVSNSKVVSHSCPKKSEHHISFPNSRGASEVIPSPDDLLRCREKVSVRYWKNELPRVLKHGDEDPQPIPIAIVKPDEILWVRIQIEHDHALYGLYDPLLGKRTMELNIVGSIKDVLDMTEERYIAQPLDTWPEPPNESKDNRFFMSAPDSLLLEADIPGAQYFRFPERQVRYSTRMRLRFWYRIAPGGDGEFKARIAQYRETPNAWKVLSDGGSEHTLKVKGRWTKFEKLITTESEATTLALDFRIANADVGEVWIDDVTLEPENLTGRSP